MKLTFDVKCVTKPLWMILRFVKIFEHDFARSLMVFARSFKKVFGRILKDPKSILEDH